jgi:hypothetical protein
MCLIPDSVRSEQKLAAAAADRDPLSQGYRPSAGDLRWQAKRLYSPKQRCRR